MDKDRIHKAALGRRPGPNREKRRLIVYAVVLGLMLILWTRAREPSVNPVDIGPTPSPFQPRAYEPLAKIDTELLASVRDTERIDRAILEPDAHQHLIGEASKLVYGDMEALGVAALAWEELTENGDEHRGQAVTALGRLAWWEPDTSTGPHAYRGELIDEQQRSWPFVVLNMRPDARADDVMRIKGFFFKHYDMLRPDLSRASGPLIVGEELLPSAFPIEPVTELRDDLFDNIRDFDLGEASQPLDSPAFFELLSFVQNTEAEELFGPVEQREPTYASELLNDPAGWRGKPVTIRGQLIHYQRMPLGPEHENPLGIPYAWQVWVLNYRDRSIAYAISLEEPVGLVPEVDIVDIDGVYFRRYAYESGRNEPAMAAAIIAKEIRRFEIPPDTLTPVLERIVLVIVIALALLIGVGQWFMGRQSRRARTATVRRKARLLKRSTELKKASGEGATDGGDDKPPVPAASTHEAGDDESDRPGASTHKAGDDESDRPGVS